MLHVPELFHVVNCLGDRLQWRGLGPRRRIGSVGSTSTRDRVLSPLSALSIFVRSLPCAAIVVGASSSLSSFVEGVLGPVGKRS